MSYSVPLASEFKTRHPRFASLENCQIDAVIEEATRQVDETWTEGDYANAIMYLTAHMLIMEGALGGDDAPPIDAGPLTGWSTGDASESYAQSRAGGDSAGQYGATEYGQRFAALRRRNVGGPVIV